MRIFMSKADNNIDALTPCTPSLIARARYVTRHGLTALFLAIAISASAHGDALAQMPFEKKTLFASVSDQNMRYYYRVPSLVTVNNGGYVVAFAEQRVADNDDYGDINVVYRVSLDHGETWTPIRRVCELGVPSRMITLTLAVGPFLLQDGF
jgi:hypothetical protein